MVACATALDPEGVSLANQLKGLRLNAAVVAASISPAAISPSRILRVMVRPLTCVADTKPVADRRLQQRFAAERPGMADDRSRD
jgi:hypothetical protein